MWRSDLFQEQGAHKPFSMCSGRWPACCSRPVSPGICDLWGSYVLLETDMKPRPMASQSRPAARCGAATVKRWLDLPMARNRTRSILAPQSAKSLNLWVDPLQPSDTAASSHLQPSMASFPLIVTIENSRCFQTRISARLLGGGVQRDSEAPGSRERNGNWRCAQQGDL